MPCRQSEGRRVGLAAARLHNVRHVRRGVCKHGNRLRHITRHLEPGRHKVACPRCGRLSRRHLARKLGPPDGPNARYITVAAVVVAVGVRSRACARRRIPIPDRRVIAAARELFAVGTEAHGCDVVRVPPQRSKPEGLLVMSRCFGSDFSQLSSRSEQSAV